MKKLLFFFCLGFSTVIFSQRKYAKEFSLATDNDLFISLTQDRYYTSGLFLSYRYLSKKSSKKTLKKIYTAQLGQHIYTPFKPNVTSVNFHDRPFAGYLYGGFSVHNFYANNSVLKLSGEIGVIGPSSLAREAMKFIHDIYGFREAIGWEYQIAEALALNFNGTYIKNLGVDNTNKIDISWYNNAKIGTVFTDISTGFYGRIAVFKPLQKLANSIAFSGNLNNETTEFNNEAEAFFYIQPTVSYVHYDATIQGSFLNTTSPVTYLLESLKFTTEFGFRFTANRFNFGYKVVYHTKKLKSTRVPKGNLYGGVVLSYQFN